DADFASTTSNQFNIRASGGLRIDVGGTSATLNGQPILSGSVGTSQIQDNAVTAAKIASGQVVKSLNGLEDAVNLTAGANVTITPSGNNLQIAAASPAYTAGSGLQLSANTFSIANNGVDNAMLASDPLSLNKVSGGTMFANASIPFVGVGRGSQVTTAEVFGLQ